MVQPSLQETGSKNIHKPSNNKEPIHEERRLQIEELDEWWTHKLKKHDKPKLCYDELNTSPNQLKVGDKVLLDAADPRITTSERNEEIPLTFIAGMRSVNSSHHLDHAEEGLSKSYMARHTGMLRPCENREKFSQHGKR
ncbi:hypothetical protein GOBAR_AA19561 [Gossypium barbadense]|uniref:Uncharacterized protein n=1 Tax=Gossypium barbadense TaxID=3634 RepID=A0A2P5XCN7_GOSBA|nr:hypothetical protein GOBAR_AA19561 [Gossypium barbadense]